LHLFLPEAADLVQGEEEYPERRQKKGPDKQGLKFNH